MTPELGFELMKLLLQVAHADLNLDDDERQKLSEMMDRLALNDADRAHIDAILRGEEKLPPPDLGALGGAGELVMRTVGEIAMADGVFADEEGEMVRQIAALLS